MSGSTEKATPSSSAFRRPSTIRMPTSVERGRRTMRHHARGEQLVEHVDVVGDARHQPARPGCGRRSERQPLQVAEELHAQVEHDRLADPLHDLVCSSRARTRRSARTGTAGRDLVEAAQVVAADAVVDRLLGQVRGRRAAARRRAARPRTASADLGAVGRAGSRAAAASAGGRRPGRASPRGRRRRSVDASSSSSSCCRRCSSA